MMRRWLLAALLLLCFAIPASAFLHGAGGNASSGGYTDFCSQANITCANAFSVRGRLVSGNTSPGTLTLFSTGATHTVIYTGSNFKVNVADAVTFCTSNGGGTTTLTYTTQYNDCGWSTIVDQTGSGCNPTQATTSHMPQFQVRLSDGESAIVQPTQVNSSTGVGARWLFATGCSGVVGTSAKSLVELTNNAYFSNCCGLFGPGETTPSVVTGSMFAGFLFTGSGPVYSWTIDGEGSGICASATLINNSPVVDGVGIGSWGGSGNNVGNLWWNNTQLATNCALASVFTTHPLNTQTGMNLGISGDHTSTGPYYVRDVVTLSQDVSATAGLATAIYNYMSAL